MIRFSEIIIMLAPLLLLWGAIQVMRYHDEHDR